MLENTQNILKNRGEEASDVKQEGQGIERTEESKQITRDTITSYNGCEGGQKNGCE